MDNNQGFVGMALGSWLVGLAGGVLAAVLLWVLGGWSFMQGAFVGFLVFVLAGGVISWIMTRPMPSPGEIRVGTPVSDKPAPSAPAAAAAPARSAAPAKKKPPAKKKAAAKKAPAKKAAVASDEGRPSGLSDKPRAGGADDLKQITGVGPKLEETLNSLGVWHFDQVAGLTKKDIAWVDERLRFKGRIERDDWKGQAKKLAKD